ncbi:MAG: hypothetical protein WAQ98_16220 [Blastocatellia bacterium]
MSAELVKDIINQTVKLTPSEKKVVAEHLLTEIDEQGQREKQKIKNQAALELMKELVETNAEYEEANWPAIEEAINATIKE